MLYIWQEYDMPYKSEKIIIAHSKYDRRIKLTKKDKARVVYLYDKGVAIREITRRFNVSRRLIQYIIFPERHARNLQQREERGGSAFYYDKDKHKEYMKGHRRYKQKLYVSKKIKI
jgi:transposase